MKEEIKNTLENKNTDTNLSVGVQLRVIPQPNTFINADCMDYLPKCPTKHFDLAIVDPPYGLNIEHIGGRGGKSSWKYHGGKNWDMEPPNKNYFNELFRVSRNQIIWGGNYFVNFIPPSMGWIFWDKKNYKFSTSDGELAYTSFNRKLKVFRRYVNEDKGFMNKEGGDIHPTQKPVALYRWILKNYAKENDSILDTHVGSASSLIACKELGFDYVGFEIDKDYYEAASKRAAGAFRKFEMEFKNDEAAV